MVDSKNQVVSERFNLQIFLASSIMAHSDLENSALGTVPDETFSKTLPFHKPYPGNFTDGLRKREDLWKRYTWNVPGTNAHLVFGGPSFLCCFHIILESVFKFCKQCVNYLFINTNCTWFSSSQIRICTRYWHDIAHKRTVCLFNNWFEKTKEGRTLEHQYSSGSIISTRYIAHIGPRKDSLSWSVNDP